MASQFDNTVKLPKTDFPMRANLPLRESELFKQQDKSRLYEKILDKNKDNPLYVLHDGPPYANGNIHLGTALNKILKDFIIKQKNMCGYRAPFIPGWDTHGLPIEIQALKLSGKNKNLMSALELREMCRDFALQNVKNQAEQFKELGVIGDYENPYLTLNHEFEAKQIEIFGEMAKKNFIYKGLKPVYWCADCSTALAEAEIEYSNDPCASIYVKFLVREDGGFFKQHNIDKDKVNFVIWTTTTWTLPGNVAVSLGSEYEYAAVKVLDEYLIIAKDLIPTVMQTAGVEDYEIAAVFYGRELEGIKLYHPFLKRDSVVILSDHVTLESGTGCVHTAPGHGIEDFEACRKYPELETVVPVDDKGVLTDAAGKFAGLTLTEANVKIAEDLKANGRLFASLEIEHQYPHCWRCKNPVIFRATMQWFCSVNDFKDDAKKAVKSVNWIPSWGQTRIENMIDDRSDWCISRQRKWGVPIPIVYCKRCKKPIINERTIRAIADMFRKEGSDGWFKREPSEFLPADFVCECGCNEFEKETDIMDVWFDSGCSHATVLDEHRGLKWPADLYLEGADQFRGWFQSSLLTASATKGKSPYKSVCVNGWVVDGEGRKMSKSLKNGVAPGKIIKKYGAEILRLWVASSDYHSDIRISDGILTQLCEVYRKIRNTARFMLGNLDGFNPNDLMSADELEDIDKWAVATTNRLLKLSLKNYETFSFYNIYHAVHNFCILDMSNFYLDIIKDRLYCDDVHSKRRKSAQSALYIILSIFSRLIAPILSFTAQEIWDNMPHTADENLESVFLNDMPKPFSIEDEDAVIDRFSRIRKIKDLTAKEIEKLRENKKIGSSLEAAVVLFGRGEDFEFAKREEKTIKETSLVSELVVVEDENAQEYRVTIEKSKNLKCERCWRYLSSVGEDKRYNTLCSRCAEVVKNIK